MDLKSTVAGIELEHPVMNAAGPLCKTVEEVEELARSPVAAVMVGSITKESRPVNPGDTYWSGPLGSLNSLGLPNGGEPYYTEHLAQMRQIVHAAGKPFFVSVAGFSPVEYGELTELAVKGGADAVELNLGCPNVWGESGTQHRIASFDPLMVEEILHQVKMAMSGFPRQCPITVKLSPFSDPLLLAEIAEVVKAASNVKAVVVVDTFPNAFAYDLETRKSAISTDLSGGLAGLAGPSLKHIALGQVLQWRKLLPADIDVIGVGGITTGADVQDYLRVGAAAVQVATAHADHGAGVFASLLAEFVGLYAVHS